MAGLDLEEVYGAYLSPPAKLDYPELFMIYGIAGSGKTHTAAEAINIEGFKKGLYIDVEGSTVGVVTDPRWSIMRVDKYPSAERIKAIAETRGIPVEEVNVEEERFKFLDTILSKKKQGLFNPVNKHEYDVIVIDSLDVAQDWAQTYFQEGAGRTVTKNGEEDGFAAWRNISKWTENIADMMKQSDAFGILVLHDKEEKSKSGAIQRLLRLSGRSKDTLPSIPDVVMYLERLVEGDEYVNVGYFGNSDGKVTKNRFGFPPAVKNVTIPKLFRFIEKQGEVDNGTQD